MSRVLKTGKYPCSVHYLPDGFRGDSTAIGRGGEFNVSPESSVVVGDMHRPSFELERLHRHLGQSLSRFTKRQADFSQNDAAASNAAVRLNNLILKKAKLNFRFRILQFQNTSLSGSS